MDLFGSRMFADNSADAVPSMYMQFIEDLTHERQYNWGGAVLACLYNNLSRAAHVGIDCIGGGLLLLMMWAWTRFPIGIPALKLLYLCIILNYFN
jgi:hypothetical protein